MSVEWVVPWYEMIIFEVLLGIAVSFCIASTYALLKIIGLLRKLLPEEKVEEVP